MDDIRSGKYRVPAQTLAAVVQRKVAAQRAALRLAKPFFGDLDRVPDLGGFDAAWRLLRCVSHKNNGKARNTSEAWSHLLPGALLSWWQLANPSSHGRQTKVFNFWLGGRDPRERDY